MKTILIEGIPGTGKTVLAEAVAEWLDLRGDDVRFVSEHVQDEGLFGDYWSHFDIKPKRMAREFLRNWRKVMRVRSRESAAYLFDNALFNQVQYLMALEMDDEALSAFYHQACAEHFMYGPVIVSLEGDAESIAGRIMAERADAWTPRVIDLIASTPYQRSRDRVGEEGLVSFMRDSMAMRQSMIELDLLPSIRCDVTAGDWKIHTQCVLNGLEERWPAG